MSWIESHTTLRTHKKLKLLCEELKISRPTAIGHLHLLWWWTLDNRENGDLSGLFDRDIAVACDWEKDPKLLIEALHKTQWMHDYKIKDWTDYAGRLLKDRERLRKWRKSNSEMLHETFQKQGEKRLTIPNLTIPLKEMFERFYSEYPKKQGKASALKAFLKLSPNDELLAEILMGVKKWSNTDNWKKENGQYIPMPSTFLNGRRWEDEVKTVAEPIKQKAFPKNEYFG